MTSSADPRRPAPTPGVARKRVAGARRRAQTPAPPTTSAGTGTATLERPDADQLLEDFRHEPTRDGETPRHASRDVPDALREEPVDEQGDEPRDDAREEAREEARDEQGDELDGDPGRPARRNARLWPALVASVLALALLGVALVYSLRPVVSDSDRSAAVGSARTTLETLLSYSGSSFDKHVDEVLPQLTSPFKDQFSKVASTDIKPMAVKNEATVQAKVYEAGVMDASGDGGEGTTVRVMAFVNQATTTKAQPTPAIDQNRVIVTMRKSGDRWLVSELAAY
ncbi:hypothetical protein [Terrabacter sp. NPDC080008]|uniref:hypothetical protein n=1 Tax=Terrabacter sp. NPDC080008 TaxID=3155176 RepID=UPI00344F0A44